MKGPVINTLAIILKIWVVDRSYHRIVFREGGI
jgi:hypothetical protein